MLQKKNWKFSKKFLSERFSRLWNCGNAQFEPWYQFLLYFFLQFFRWNFTFEGYKKDGEQKLKQAQSLHVAFSIKLFSKGKYSIEWRRFFSSRDITYATQISVSLTVRTANCLYRIQSAPRSLHRVQSAPRTVCIAYSLHSVQSASRTVCIAYSLHRVQSAPRSVCTAYNLHRVQSAPRTVCIAYSLHRVQSASRTVCTSCTVCTAYSLHLLCSSAVIVFYILLKCIWTGIRYLIGFFRRYSGFLDIVCFFLSKISIETNCFLECFFLHKTVSDFFLDFLTRFILSKHLHRNKQFFPNFFLEFFGKSENIKIFIKIYCKLQFVEFFPAFTISFFFASWLFLAVKLYMKIISPGDSVLCLHNA